MCPSYNRILLEPSKKVFVISISVMDIVVAFQVIIPYKLSHTNARKIDISCVHFHEGWSEFKWYAVCMLLKI